MRTRTRASCHRRGPSSSSGQHWSARDAGSRMALNVLIAVPRRHGFMSPHGHCLWARVPQDREGVGLEDPRRACILRILRSIRRRHDTRPTRARPSEKSAAGPASRAPRDARKCSPRECFLRDRPPPTPPPPHPGVILFGKHCTPKKGAKSCLQQVSFVASALRTSMFAAM
jgi:hypothetical protein